MSGFSISGFDAVHPALWAAQSDVPGELIFVLVQDSSTDGKELRTITVAPLDFVRNQTYDFEQGDRVEPLDYIEMYVLFPKGADFPKFDGLVRCDLGVIAGKEPGDGPRMILTNNIGVLWSCDL